MRSYYHDIGLSSFFPRAPTRGVLTETRATFVMNVRPYNYEYSLEMHYLTRSDVKAKDNPVKLRVVQSSISYLSTPFFGACKIMLFGSQIRTLAEATRINRMKHVTSRPERSYAALCSIHCMWTHAFEFPERIAR